MRLIDADALHRELVVEMVKCIRMSEETKGSMAERVLNKVDEAPTIEAEPVKHGRWLEVQEEQYLVESLVTIGYECSECGNSEGWNKMNYCPNCGAKMDLEG